MVKKQLKNAKTLRFSVFASIKVVVYFFSILKYVSNNLLAAI